MPLTDDRHDSTPCSRRSPSRASTTCASASASRSPTRSSRGATRPRATTSATTPTASATTTRCGAIPDYAAKTQLRRHHRAAELPVRHQPHHLGLCRRPARRPRHVVGRRLDLAQAGAAQRRDHDRGLAQGPDRAPDAIRRPRGPADLSRRLLQPARRPGRRAPTAGASAPSATTRASRAPSTRRCKARAAAALHRRGAGRGLRALRERGDPRRRRRATGRTCNEGEALPTMVKGPMTVTGFIAYAQGWGGLYIRANKLAWKHDRRASRPRHQEPLRHPRLPRARALGGGVRARGRRARRLRLRPRALLVADPPPDQLDGRRRLPAPRALQDPPPQSRRATCCSSRARSTRKCVEDGRHLVEIEQEARNQDGELSVVGGGVVELPVAR